MRPILAVRGEPMRSQERPFRTLHSEDGGLFESYRLRHFFNGLRSIGTVRELV